MFARKTTSRKNKNFNKFVLDHAGKMFFQVTLLSVRQISDVY